MDTRNIPKPSTQAVGITTFVLSLLGLCAGAWYYQNQSATRTQRLRRKADRQLKQVRGRFQNDHMSTGAISGLAIAGLGAAVALLLGGSEVYRRTQK